MAPPSAASDRIGNDLEVSRNNIHAAIAKSVELRALHSALLHGAYAGDSAAHLLRIGGAASSSPSPLVARSASTHFSAQDYPVFMPSYGDEPYVSESRTPSGTWGSFRFGLGSMTERAPSDCGRENLTSWSGYKSHICPVDGDQKYVNAPSAADNILVASPGLELFKSGRMNSPGDVKSVSSCNRCKPAVITSVQSNTIVPLTNPLPSALPRPTKGHHGSGVFLSWLIPRMKKNRKCENSLRRTASEEVSLRFKDLGTASIEALRRELLDVHEHRDAALAEVTEMRSSLGELRDKLLYLETYCEGLKKALREATEKECCLTGTPMKGKSVNLTEGGPMPVTEEVMMEGFLQIVSEARLSVRQFCKTLISQINEADTALTDSLDSLLRPYKLSINLRYSKVVLHHLEAVINQSLYQDFENCVFRRNGSLKILDPHQYRHSRFAAFVSLRNLSWNEVLKKGTKYYSEEFSRFCDQKMGGVVSTLNWTRPWPESLLQAFFVAAKCVWLLHLLAFSFDTPIRILRVEGVTEFNSEYMEDVFASRQRPQEPCRVKVMVSPGFYVDDSVFRCKVICKYKSVT
ncbi:hypothetical protein MLD38_025374 [Melastoma candidum]|uniref:Uncharacterized protein n=1 Tax=Melastoma candidum TaxID=119954 RepID=A0ACB9NY96_9MYRT|nr:hypothetical protein MLD38_025374 [Melastoma candidum]